MLENTTGLAISHLMYSYQHTSGLRNQSVGRHYSECRNVNSVLCQWILSTALAYWFH